MENEKINGKYFIGHTPFLTLSHNFNAWGGLINPADSGVNLYINTFTVSNISNTPFQTQQWLNSEPLGNFHESTYVSPANTSIHPLPTSHIALNYASHVRDLPSSGTSLFTRISQGNSTIVGNYYGKIVVPPKGSFIVYLYSVGGQHIKADVALGWWEDKI